MEFGSILNLPEEKIVEICSQMDNETLTRFLSVSQDTKRICGEVLSNRIKEYDRKARDIMFNVVVPKVDYFKLISTDPDRQFEIRFAFGPSKYIIREYLNLDIFITRRLVGGEKIGSAVNGEMLDTDEMLNLLIELMKLNYITGDYEVRLKEY